MKRLFTLNQPNLCWLGIIPFPKISCPVWKSGNFSKSGLSRNWTFSFPEDGFLKLFNNNEKVTINNPKKFIHFFLLFTFLKRRRFNLMNINENMLLHMYLVGSGRTWLQIWVSGPVRSENSYVQSIRALTLMLLKH